MGDAYITRRGVGSSGGAENLKTLECRVEKRDVASNSNVKIGYALEGFKNITDNSKVPFFNSQGLGFISKPIPTTDTKDTVFVVRPVGESASNFTELEFTKASISDDKITILKPFSKVSATSIVKRWYSYTASAEGANSQNFMLWYARNNSFPQGIVPINDNLFALYFYSQSTAGNHLYIMGYLPNGEPYIWDTVLYIMEATPSYQNLKTIYTFSPDPNTVVVLGLKYWSSIVLTITQTSNTSYSISKTWNDIDSDSLENLNVGTEGVAMIDESKRKIRTAKGIITYNSGFSGFSSINPINMDRFTNNVAIKLNNIKDSDKILTPYYSRNVLSNSVQYSNIKNGFELLPLYFGQNGYQSLSNKSFNSAGTLGLSSYLDLVILDWTKFSDGPTLVTETAPIHSIMVGDPLVCVQSLPKSVVIVQAALIPNLFTSSTTPGNAVTSYSPSAGSGRVALVLTTIVIDKDTLKVTEVPPMRIKVNNSVASSLSSFVNSGDIYAILLYPSVVGVGDKLYVGMAANHARISNLPELNFIKTEIDISKVKARVFSTMEYVNFLNEAIVDTSAAFSLGSGMDGDLVDVAVFK